MPADALPELPSETSRSLRVGAPTPATIATTGDFTTVYGDVPDAAASRVQYLLDVASSRLTVKLPGLEARIASDPNLARLAKDVVVQAAIRQFDPTKAATQFSQTAGPFSMNLNTGARVNRGWFYDDELELLTQAMNGDVGLGFGTIRLGLSDWTA
jgi:hypothetical protein